MTIRRAVTTSATATDNVGVVGGQFKLDGANLGAELLQLPIPYLASRRKWIGACKKSMRAAFFVGEEAYDLTKVVDPAGELVRTAKSTGISFGD